MDDIERLEPLARAADALVAATTPPDVFHRLLEATRLGAPRSAVLLKRGTGWKGWGGLGIEAERLSEVRAWSIDSTEGWVAALDRSAVGVGLELDGPPFPLTGCDERWGIAVRVGGKTIAALVAGRRADELPWSPPSLAILASVARARLELELALRRASSVSPSRPPLDTEGTPEPPAKESRAASPQDGGGEIAPWQSAGTEPGPRGRRLDEARRYARLVATDIRLYNENDVALGRRHGDLAARLGDQLERGRESFARRFPELGDEGTSLLEDAYVQVLAGGNATLLP